MYYNTTNTIILLTSHSLHYYYVSCPVFRIIAIYTWYLNSFLGEKCLATSVVWGNLGTKNIRWLATYLLVTYISAKISINFKNCMIWCTQWTRMKVKNSASKRGAKFFFKSKKARISFTLGWKLLSHYFFGQFLAPIVWCIYK